MTNRNRSTEVSQSICEAALERYSDSDDSLAELIKQNCIEVRDFMILSFVCDQGELTIGQIVRLLGLSESTTEYCVERLTNADLIRYTQDDSGFDGNRSVCPTPTGRLVARRIHSGVEDSG